MPNWQRIEEAYASLLKVRAVFDDAMLLVIQTRNAGALPVLEILAREVEQLAREMLAAFGPAPAVRRDA